MKKEAGFRGCNKESWVGCEFQFPHQNKQKLRINDYDSAAAVTTATTRLQLFFCILTCHLGPTPHLLLSISRTCTPFLPFPFITWLLLRHTCVSLLLLFIFFFSFLFFLQIFRIKFILFLNFMTWFCILFINKLQHTHKNKYNYNGPKSIFNS